jgi:4-hydroxyphenylacetate 3-hydroxylase, reductase component
MSQTAMRSEPRVRSDDPASGLPRLHASAMGRASAVCGNFDALDLRRAMGGFATGVTVVTSCDPSGQRAGVTVNSFCSVSLEPPLVLWCLARNAPSLGVFSLASHFAIHVLAADQIGLSVRFSRPAADKFEGLQCAEGLGGAPLFDGAAVRFECRREHSYESGDHLILIGRIERYCYSECAPLLFHGGRMHTADGE